MKPETLSQVFDEKNAWESLQKTQEMLQDACESICVVNRALRGIEDQTVQGAKTLHEAIENCEKSSEYLRLVRHKLKNVIFLSQHRNKKNTPV